MWKSHQQPAVAPLSQKMKIRLAAERGLTDQDAARLRMKQEQGEFAGRKVTYFWVFDPAAVTAADGDIRQFRDLDACGVVHYGHIEKDGQIILNLRTSDLLS